MALDTFSKSGVSTYAFTRGNTYPITRKYTPNQTRSISGGGAAKVVGLGSVQEFWSVALINISDSDSDLFYAFFNNSLINWGEQLFIWTDFESTARTVRLWDTNITFSKVGSDLNSIKIQLKIE